MAGITIDQLEQKRKIAVDDRHETDLANEIIEDLECWVSQYNGVVTSGTTFQQAGFGYIAAEPDTPELLDQGFYNHVDGSYDIIDQNNEDE